MSMRNLAVLLDVGVECRRRLVFATEMARRLGAGLTGIFITMAPAHRVGLVADWPSEEYVAALDATERVFREVTSPLAREVRFVDLNRGGEKEILDRSVRMARMFDLVIAGQWRADAHVPRPLVERLIVESGRPVLVLPFIHDGSDIGHRPLFAWHNSAGSARALNDALPLLRTAADSVVIEVVSVGDHKDEFGSMILGHLAAHSISAQFHEVIAENIGVMDLILASASDFEADVLVLGAFDAKSLLSVGRGGGTRHVLDHMTLPVLFSH